MVEIAEIHQLKQTSYSILLTGRLSSNWAYLVNFFSWHATRSFGKFNPVQSEFLSKIDVGLVKLIHRLVELTRRPKKN